jgi:hypothetical protein
VIPSLAIGLPGFGSQVVTQLGGEHALGQLLLGLPGQAGCFTFAIFS